MNWQSLRLIQKRKNGRAIRPRVVATPVLSMHFYVPQLVEGLGQAVSDAANLFVDFAGDHLRQYWTQSYYTPTTTKGVRRMLANLAKRGGVVDIDGGENHEPGDYGVFARVAHQGLRFTESFIRFDLPVRYGERQHVEPVVALYEKLLERLPFETSNCGFGFKTLAGASSSGESEICKRLMTYQGFDPGYHDVAQEMAGCTYTAHWLNAVNRQMAERLGGERALGELAKDVRITRLKTGILLRSADTPPIGKLVKGKRDVGAMPEVARYLRPLRCGIKGLGGNLDAQVWLARFDA